MKHSLILMSMIALSGCGHMDALSTNLSADPIPSPDTETALINVLLEPLSKDGTGSLTFIEPQADIAERTRGITRYLNAGMTLTDIYCDRFFRQTNAAYRKRKFGRGATNDTGTAIAAVLGLSNVGTGVVSGVATGFGLADSTWRNYDESFVVSPQLSTMRSLVTAAQDKFRADTFKDMPKDYMTARSIIVRYSGICSFLGMQGLLDQSVDQQRRELQEGAAPTSTSTSTPTPTPTPTPTSTPTPTPTRTPAATPAPTPAATSEPGPLPAADAQIPTVPVQ